MIRSNKNVLISIGMPIYNGSKFLHQAIKSVLNQSYSNLELIISDDISSDTSTNICMTFAKNDKRVRFFLQKKRLGSIANFNFVLSKAKGEYFMWTAQDDIRAPNALKKLSQLLTNYPSAIIAVSNFNNLFHDQSYSVYKNELYDNSCTHLDSLVHFVDSGNLSYFYGLWRTNILKKTSGYHVDSRPIFKSSDFLTIFKALLMGKFVYTDGILFYKRDTGLFSQQFTILKKKHWSPEVTRRIKRYLLFPIFYCYDFSLASYYLIKSNFSIIEKLIVEKSLFIRFMKNNIGFIFNVSRGASTFAVRMLNKITQS